MTARKESPQAKARRQERQRKYYLDHREELREKNRAYYKEHSEKWKVYGKGLTDEEKEQNREYQRLYYQAHREACIAAARRWQVRNPDKVEAYRRNSLARKKQKMAAGRMASVDTGKAKALFKDPSAAEHLQWLVNNAKERQGAASF